MFASLVLTRSFKKAVLLHITDNAELLTVAQVRWPQVPVYCDVGAPCIVSSDEHCQLLTVKELIAQRHSQQNRSSSTHANTAIGVRRLQQEQERQEEEEENEEEGGRGLLVRRATTEASAGENSNASVLAKATGPHLTVQSLRAVVLREYYSSKYDDDGSDGGGGHSSSNSFVQSIPLGPRFQFQRVSRAERRAGHRHFLFNFLGSVREQHEPDRNLMLDVLRNTSLKGIRHVVHLYDHVLRNPNETKVVRTS